MSHTARAISFTAIGKNKERLPGRGEKATLWSITYGPGGYVASGWRNSGGVTDADVNPLVWLSRDGLTWTEAADPADVFGQPGDQLIQSIAWHNDRLVAVGLDGDAKTFNAAIWTSP